MKVIAPPLQVAVLEGANPHLMGRLRDGSGTAFMQSDFTGDITRDIFDMADDPGSELAIESDAISVASSVFNSLQTDGYWDAADVDSVGYNFRDTVPATKFPTADRRYRVRYQGTTSAEGVVTWEYIVRVKRA